MATKTTVKSFFKTGDIPTEAQFAESWDSTVFLDELDELKPTDIFNVSEYNNTAGITVEYTTVLQAAAAVPNEFRKPGLVMTYWNSGIGWSMYVYNATNLTSWTTTSSFWTRLLPIQESTLFIRKSDWMRACLNYSFGMNILSGWNNFTIVGTPSPGALNDNTSGIFGTPTIAIDRQGRDPGGSWDPSTSFSQWFGFKMTVTVASQAIRDHILRYGRAWAVMGIESYQPELGQWGVGFTQVRLMAGTTNTQLVASYLTQSAQSLSVTNYNIPINLYIAIDSPNPIALS